MESFDRLTMPGTGQWAYKRAASKPQRSNFASNLISLTVITYISMCILSVWFLLVASEANIASKKSATEGKYDLMCESRDLKCM